MPNFMAFLSYIIITTYTPGPNVIMSMSNAAKYGLKKALPFNLGAAIGVFILMLLSSIFSVALYKFIPSIKPVLTYIGAIYILYLAWKIFKSKTSYDDKDNNNNNKTTTSIMSGLLLQFVNPKVIIFCITTVTTFIIPYYNSIITLALFSAAIALTGFSATFCWALFGSVFQKLLMKNEKIINTVMALLLVYCAVSLFL